VWRTKKSLSLNVGPMSNDMRAVVTELSVFDVILGRPWLARWNPRIYWRGDKLLVSVNGQAHLVDASLDPSVTNSTLALSKSIPKPCYKQYTGTFKIDTEMTCYRQYTGVLKIATEIASVLYIRVHSSRDRHCCIYR
jgi:hypothetical protein